MMRKSWQACLLVLCLCSTIYSFAQDDPNCAGAPLPRLASGGYGQVTEGASNNVRDQASRDGTRLNVIPPGGIFMVLEGPVCADGFNWWRVEYNGFAGWTVEGSGADYFVFPVDAPIEAVSNIAYPISAENRLEIGVQARIAFAGLNIYASSDSASPVIRQSMTGEMVDIIGNANPVEETVWWQIRASDGIEGWIVEQFQQEANASLRETLVLQTLFPVCPYNSERLSFVLYPYIYSSSPDGTHRCVLYQLETLSTFSPTGLKYMLNDTFWSPEGDSLLFLDFDSAVNCCAFRLYSMSADGSSLRNLSPDTEVDWAEWSPDGTRIAAIMNHQAWIMNPDGTGALRLSEANRRIDYIAWYPDAETVFYVEYNPENPDAVQVYTRTELIFYSQGINDDSPLELFRLDGDIEVTDISLSPSANHFVARIVDLNQFSEPVGSGIYLYNMESLERHPLDAEWGYLWSPDGQFIVEKHEGSRVIDTISLEAGNLENFYPDSWSSDWQRLYSTLWAGFAVYDLASGEIQNYLEEEITPLVDSYGNGSILSIREQSVATGN